jgi:DNA-binding MarR family transcriptional regulator
VHTSRQAADRDANLLGTLATAVAGRFDTSSEAAALVALHVYLGGSPIEALRRVLGLSHPATVRLVDRLQDRGLLRRAPGDDGRTVALTLTPAGRTRARDLQARRTAAVAEVLDVLDGAERAALGGLLEALLGGLVAGRADARRLCRLCDADACGHHDGRCPVTNAARERAPGDYARARPSRSNRRA